jgi:RNA polymerase sigma-70 factor (ECF subfamily)
MTREITQPRLASPDGSASAGRPAGDEVAQLVEQARAGRTDAWARLYQRYFAQIFRHVRYLGGEQAAVEDLVQEVFARALVALRDFDGRSSFSTWLHGIAVNVARNHWRASTSTQTAHDRLRAIQSVRESSQQPDVDRTHLARERARAVYAVLAGLPEHLREAFVLRDLEGLAPDEAAAQLGISPGNLAVRATRARQRVRAELERQGWLEPLEVAP